jgi:hypothetical protein
LQLINTGNRHIYNTLAVNAFAFQVQQLQQDNAAMSQTIRALQAQLVKRPRSPAKPADKSALLPRMIKDR